MATGGALVDYDPWFDSWFRLVLVVLVIALYCYEHMLYRRPIFRRNRRKSSGDVEFWLSVSAWFGVGSTLLYVAGVLALPVLSAPLPSWLRWVGVGVMTVCIPFSAQVHRALGPNFSMDLKLRTNHRLVKEGPYAYVRHPMYSALLLCAIGACLVSANYVIMAASVAATIVIVARIKKEETMMIGRFGEAYRHYQRQTGALLPKLLQ